MAPLFLAQTLLCHTQTILLQDSCRQLHRNTDRLGSDSKTLEKQAASSSSLASALLARFVALLRGPFFDFCSARQFPLSYRLRKRPFLLLFSIRYSARIFLGMGSGCTVAGDAVRGCCRSSVAVAWAAAAPTARRIATLRPTAPARRGTGTILVPRVVACNPHLATRSEAWKGRMRRVLILSVKTT